MRRTYSKPFWLIARHRTGGMEALRITLGSGEEMLPVFSFEDEARMFLDLGASGSGWRPRETSAGELISMLYSLYAGVDRVVLDPLSAPFAGLNDLLSMGSEAFAKFACEQKRGESLGLIFPTDQVRQRTPKRSGAKDAEDQRSGPCVNDGRSSYAATPAAAFERG